MPRWQCDFDGLAKANNVTLKEGPKTHIYIYKYIETDKIKDKKTNKKQKRFQIGVDRKTRERQRKTEKNRERQRKTEKNRERQRKTEKDRERQRKTEKDRDRPLQPVAKGDF